MPSLIKNRFTNSKFHFAIILLFCFWSIFAFWYTSVTTGNYLHGDEWRFLLIFYKKWIDGTLTFKNLFSDHHPMLLHPLVFLANAKWFSMQMKYSAFFGIAAKVVTGVFILKILLQKQVPLRWAIYRRIYSVR